MNIKGFIGLLLCLPLTNCSPIDKEAPTNSIESYTISLDQNLSTKNTQLYGSGKITFDSPLLGINSKEHYVLKFRMLNSNSFVTLSSHFSSFDFSDGVEIKFFQKEKRLLFQVSVPGYPKTSEIELMQIEPDHEIRLRVEVHNGVSSGIRLVIWSDFISYQGEILSRQDQIYLGNHLFDSESEPSALFFLNHGKGPRWGLEIHRLQLLEAFREAAYVN